MEKVIEIGKYYELQRTFGRKIRGKLVEWKGKDQRLVIDELNNTGRIALDKLDDQEFISLKEIDADTFTKG